MASTTGYTFTVRGEVKDPTVVIFYFPWHRQRDRRDRQLLVSLPKDTGKAG